MGRPPTIHDQEGRIILEQEKPYIPLAYSGDFNYFRNVNIEIFREHNIVTRVISAIVYNKNGFETGVTNGMLDLPTYARSNIERRKLHDRY